MKIPHPITPADVMDIVPLIKKVEIMTVGDQNKQMHNRNKDNQDRLGIEILPATINLGVQSDATNVRNSITQPGHVMERTIFTEVTTVQGYVWGKEMPTKLSQ